MAATLLASIGYTHPGPTEPGFIVPAPGGTVGLADHKETDMKITRKLLPLLAAVQLAMAGASTAQAAYLSVGYFNGGGDVTAGPGGDIDKLDVTQITHLN